MLPPSLLGQTEEAAKVAAQQEAKAMRRRVDELEVGAWPGLFVGVLMVADGC